MKLFQIDEEIMKCIDTETGEIIDTERLDELQMERDVKVENIACWIKNLLSDVEALKAQEKTFADRRRVEENKAESLKGYLAKYLAGRKFSTDKVAISFRKTSSVNITDMTKIPEQYLKYSEPTADKMAIKKAINAGEKIEGAEIAESQSISIK